MEDNNNKTETQKEKIDSEDKYTLLNVWNNIPIFIKTLFITTMVLYILDKLFDDSFSFNFSNITYLSIHQIEIWRLFTTNFITTNFLKIFLGFVIWSKYASAVELSIGTIKYSLLFLINSLFIQLIYCIIIILLSKITRNELFLTNKVKRKYIENSGFWGIAMCEMTLFCLSNPDIHIILLLIPLTVKAKIYPFILMILFFIINRFNVDWEIISGAIYGLFYHFFLYKYLQISDNLVLKIENFRFIKWISKFDSFVSINKIYNETSASGSEEKENKNGEKDTVSNNDQETELGKLKVMNIDDSSNKNEKESNESEKK